MAAHDPDLESEYARRRRVARWAGIGAVVSSLIAGVRIGLLVSRLIPAPLAVALTSIAFIAAGLVMLDRLAGAGPRTIIASAAFVLPPLCLNAFWLLMTLFVAPLSGVGCYVLVESIAMCVAGLALATANARRDARKRPSDCMRCGYPLEGVAANRCPECGTIRGVNQRGKDDKAG